MLDCPTVRLYILSFVCPSIWTKARSVSEQRASFLSTENSRESKSLFTTKGLVSGDCMLAAKGKVGVENKDNL
jgi:hypothetical protein